MGFYGLLAPLLRLWPWGASSGAATDELTLLEEPSNAEPEVSTEHRLELQAIAEALQQRLQLERTTDYVSGQKP
jgi:hypothetical protein